MKRLNGVAEILELVDRCLQEEDWDRLAGLEAVPPSGRFDGDTAALRATLASVEEMQARIRERMNDARAELDALPTLRHAAKAYLSA